MKKWNKYEAIVVDDEEPKERQLVTLKDQPVAIIRHVRPSKKEEERWYCVALAGCTTLSDDDMWNAYQLYAMANEQAKHDVSAVTL